MSSLFPEYEQPADIYNLHNNENNDEQIYNQINNPDATIPLYITKRNAIEIELANSGSAEGSEQIATLQANPGGDQTSIVLKDAKIIQNGLVYRVVNVPSYLQVTDVTQIQLKQDMSNPSNQ